jgi:hypothetical protein
VVVIRDDNADQAPVLVVEDCPEQPTSDRRCLAEILERVGGGTPKLQLWL